eukprot:7830599-Pyramimonas_sp.AAC.1
MKCGKCKHQSGIVAEMLKASSNRFWGSVLGLFSDVFGPSAAMPETWKTARLIVLFKKGGPLLVKNYRPIAILPILYELIARMLCNGLRPIIMSEQPTDQAAYRKGYHHTYRCDLALLYFDR